MPSIDPIQRLIHAFSKLPSVGEKLLPGFTSIYSIGSPEIAEEIANALSNLHSEVKFCSECAHLSAQDPCRFCSSQKRNLN